jgi:hypothetical protein
VATNSGVANQGWVDGLGVGVAGHRQVLGGRRGPTTGQVELAAAVWM